MVRKTKITKPDDVVWRYEREGALAHREGLRQGRARGAYAPSWWAAAWEDALRSFMDPERLERGRSYVRRGQVIELCIARGQIVARVQGTRPTPYRLRIGVRTFGEAEWASAIDSLAQQAGYSAMLLNGELPRDIIGLFDELGLSLLPRAEDELEQSCSCPDGELPCRHLAAVLLLVGAQFDREPFLLLALRGRTQEQVVQALRERRADMLDLPGDAVDSGPLPADAAGPERTARIDLERFWQLGPELAAVQVRVRPPDIDHEVLQLLGDPEFAGDEALVERLKAVYETVSSRALDVAFGESAAPSSEDNEGSSGSQ